MSAQSSVFASSTANTQDALLATYATTAVGSRYEAAPQTVTDGQLRGIQIDALGRVVVIGPTADQNAFINRPVGAGGIYRLTPPTYADGNATIFHMDVNGNLKVVNVAGTAIIGKVGIDQTTPGTTNGVVLNAGANIAGKFGIDQTTPGTTNGVQLTAGSAIAGKFGIDQTTPGTTNGVQVNAALPVGANVIGKVSIDQTTPGTTNLVALAANQSVNVAQMNGVTTTMGNGVAGTGVQRVAIASDNTAFPVKIQDSAGASIAVGQKTMSASVPVVLASDHSAIAVSGTAATTTGTVSSATDVFAAVDVSAYASISLQIVITATATVTFRGSNDNVNFKDVLMQAVGSGGAPTTILLSSNIVCCPVEFKYFKPVVTSYGSGSITGTMIAGQADISYPGLNNPSRAWNLSAADVVTIVPGAGGRLKANAPVYNDYGSTNVTTAAYVQLVASTTAATSEVEIYDTGGNAIYLATGAAASEVNQIIIPPGGNGRIPLAIAASTRVSVKAVATSSTTAGSFLVVNFYA